MNQIFCFKRYLWLVKRQWYENAAIYKWGIVLMVLMTGLLFWLSSTWKTVDNGYKPFLGQMPTFALTGILFLYIYGANFFDSLTSRHKKMFYFSLPALPLERIAVAFTFVIVLLPVLFLLVFTIFDFFAVQLFNHIHGAASVQMFFKTASPVGHIALFVMMILSYLSFTSIFTLGSLMFGKQGAIILLIPFSFIQFVFSLFLVKILSYEVYELILINVIVSIFLLPFWWVLMYFVMKRKEAS